MCDFCMGMGSCFYPMTREEHQGSDVEITYFHTRPLSAWIVSQSWDNAHVHWLSINPLSNGPHNGTVISAHQSQHWLVYVVISKSPIQLSVKLGTCILQDISN